jgi:N-sulfoglucosamine sulfohydrolase
MHVSGCVFRRLSLIALVSLSSAVHAQDTLRPNIVLIVSDGHGKGDLGCYGNTIIKTPNLDKLANEGVRMTNAFSTSAGSASYSVILTGLYNHATGQYGQAQGYNHFSLFPEIKSLPYYLKQAGYRTARVGKFDAAPESIFPFDTILGSDINERNPYEMAQKSISFIAGTNKKPFFLYFSPGDPARSGELVETSGYQSDRFGNREKGYDNIIPTYYKPAKMTVPASFPDSPECRAELAQYAQAVSRLDLGIGRLLELLHENGIWNNTIVIYISCNGAAFPGAKTNLYNAGIEVPCIIKPVLPVTNHTCDALMNTADILPTILDEANALPAEYTFHGRSLKNDLSQQHPVGWDETYASQTFYEITSYYPMRMVMNRRYKLIWNITWQLAFPISNELMVSASWQGILKSGEYAFGQRQTTNYLQRPEFELYDWQEDLGEIKNLASNPEYENILEDLKARLKGFQMKTNDPWILKWAL